MINNSRAILNLRHLKCLEAPFLAPKSLFQRWETDVQKGLSQAQGHCQCLSRPGCAPRSLLLNALPNPFLWPWHCLVAGPAGQPEFLLSSGGSFAVSTLQQPLRRQLEARKCWLVGLCSGWSAQLTLCTAQPSPFPCTVVNRERHEERRKPHLAAASSRNHPSLVKNPLLIRITES